MNYWRGKRAVVTGGSGSLGRALATALTQEGARVAIVARGRAALDETAKQLRAIDGDVLAVTADVTKPEDVSSLTGKVQAEWGGVDLLAHCAGRSMRGNVLATSADEFRDLWEANFLSVVRLTQAFADTLVANRGHVVLVGSLASRVAPRYLGAYPPSKFAVAALAQQLRLELSEQDVHVLLVCPGPIVREKEAERYVEQAIDVPPEAYRPAGGAKVRRIDPRNLAARILRACERRQMELIVPRRARLLFALTQLSPRWGDWLLRKMTAE